MGSTIFVLIFIIILSLGMISMGNKMSITRRKDD
jgi:hypothetical protein